ncbi:MAG: type IX secretion system outer membrane channel protein PorV [Flavobacteriales bacterium]
MKKTLLGLLIASSLYANTAFGQDQKNNVVTTAVPFLLISPDARAGGMGDQGVATLPDENSISWNLAKLAHLEQTSGVSVSYSPWLQELVGDISLSNVSMFHKLNKTSALAMNIRYFSLGDVTFRNSAEDAGYTFGPNEFAISGGYSRKLTRSLSAGLTFKYVHSQLSDNAQSLTEDTKNGSTVAADVSVFYEGKTFDFSGKDAYMTYGLSINNVGGKIKYSESGDEEFLPANMRLGSGLHVTIDDYNSVSFTAELSKLLVPTPPERVGGAESEIISGKDPNVGVVGGIFQSFTDSPDGETELQEVMWSFGAEYWYNKQFAFRGGFFHENQYKGERQYATLGLGLKLEKASIDASYLIPTKSGSFNPLKNTLRFSLNVNLDALISPAPAEKKAEETE